MPSGTTLRESFEQTASHWHFIDQYLSDFGQEPDESTADLDLRIRELVKGCKFQPGPGGEKKARVTVSCH